MAAQLHILPVVHIARVSVADPALPDDLTNVVRMRDYRALVTDMIATFRPGSVRWMSLLPPLDMMP